MKNRTNKYNAKKTVIDGWTFDSKSEAKRYQELKILQSKGEIDYFLCQVPFRLPGNIIYRCDFQIFSKGYYKYEEIIFPFEKNIGDLRLEVRYEDVKGFMTPASKIKIKQVQDIYGINIDLITKKGVINL